MPLIPPGSGISGMISEQEDRKNFRNPHIGDSGERSYAQIPYRRLIRIHHFHSVDIQLVIFCCKWSAHAASGIILHSVPQTRIAKFNNLPQCVLITRYHFGNTIVNCMQNIIKRWFVHFVDTQLIMSLRYSRCAIISIIICISEDLGRLRVLSVPPADAT